MRPTLNAIAILAFGVIALVGLIVLAGTGHLDDATRGILQAVAFASLTGAGVATVPAVHPQPAPPVLLERGGMSAGAAE